ncbi:hypothetical protein DVH24_041275 [Malus domestica]|uniref:GDSL esterase/lipase n=1 Tax=Malus domestica TaxID=3750 RepID=A0A498I8N5_MALDO|nr:hypothetical protein DVH24_041275 [Malus domestica]
MLGKTGQQLAFKGFTPPYLSPTTAGPKILQGFVNANSACCHVAGRFGGLIPCGPPSEVCRERSKYIFWDPYHPSDAANLIIARRLLYGNSNDISPINVLQLIQS